jgi:hypothetical protein
MNSSSTLLEPTAHMEIKVDEKCIEWIKKLFYHKIFMLLRQEILLSGECT